MIIKQCLIKTYVLPPPSPHLIIDNKLNWSVQESDPTFYHNMLARPRPLLILTTSVRPPSQIYNNTKTLTLLSYSHFALYSVFSPLSVSSHWPHLCYSQFRLDTSSTWAGNYWLVPDSGLLTRLCKTENTVWKWFYIDLGKLNSKSNQASTLELSTSPGYLCIVPPGQCWG